MNEENKHIKKQKVNSQKDASEELGLDKAIRTLKKHSAFYQIAGFTHISSLLS